MEAAGDVIILGSGITGCALGLVLARQGIATTIIDARPHPRFALGESLLKPTVLWMRVLAARYGVDELATIANLNRIHDEIAPSSGVKKGFGFVRHEPGRAATSAHWWANIAVSYAEEVLEAHLFRQDIDAWLQARAAAAGCRVLCADILGERTDAHGGVCLETSAGPVRGRFLVDCVGHGATLARVAALSAPPAPLRTDSRVIFTHLTGVRPFDACGAAPAPALPWHDGTLHHLLEGAWMWVIPFDNHPRSRNDLVSVGVSFDNRVHPPGAAAPAAEWQALLARYPALAAQFGGAVAVRPWVASPRVQSAPGAVIGERVCLLGAPAGNVDALYSRGLLNTFQSLHLLAGCLLDALAADDFAPARFAPLARLQHSLVQVHDHLVSGSYSGFRSVALTDWWLAAWSLVEQLSLARVVPSLAALERDDAAAWASAQADLADGECITGQATVLPALAAGCAAMDAFAAGALDEAAAVAALAAAGAPLAPLGFDLARFRALTRRHAFGPSAQRLLGVEHALTAAVEIVDRCAGLPLTLRSSAFVNALVRLLALRYARVETVELVAAELAPALTATLARLALPGSDQVLLERLVAGLERLSLKREQVTAPAPLQLPPAGWSCLLETRAEGRYVGLRVRAGSRAGHGELELVTSADGTRLVLGLAGALPPAELLAALL
ncbi:MAG: hypothetical protein RLW62_15920 [Gammaproteobacteria bacterium]